jgi:uncharacterized membrane protein YhfC
VGFRPTVSEDDILVSRFLERTASYLLALFVSGALCLIAALAILLNSVSPWALDTKVAPRIVRLSCGLENLWFWLRFARRRRLPCFCSRCG